MTPQGNDMVKQRDADLLEPLELCRESFFKWGLGNFIIFPKDYWGNRKYQGERTTYRRRYVLCPSEATSQVT
jgi:hypothetical protein